MSDVMLQLLNMEIILGNCHLKADI